MEMNLGRLENFDERSRNFPIRTLVEGLSPRSYVWRIDERLDQKSSSACVGFAFAAELAARPVEVPGVTNETGLKIYEEARKHDQFPGENYHGSSVLGGVKAVKHLWPTAFESYRWCFSVDDLALAVSYSGPTVIGVNFYRDMYNPDSSGYVKPGGGLVGGHAMLVRGINVTLRHFRVLNSWSERWGKNGECFISFDDMHRLLSERGEACVVVRRRQVTI